MTQNRLCIDCSAWINSDDLDLNPSGLWCIRCELQRRRQVASGFTRAPVEPPSFERQTRYGNQEKGMPWTVVDRGGDPHAYLSKPLPPPPKKERPLVTSYQTVFGRDTV